MMEFKRRYCARKPAWERRGDLGVGDEADERGSLVGWGK